MMISIFRKIRKNLFESGEAKRYFLYASGEILLVMIGILLALQVNNWNEDRKNLAIEKVILKELNKEFKANLKEFNENFRAIAETYQSLIYIVESFPIDLNKIDLDTLIQKMERMHYKGNYDSSTASLDKLQNTSSLEIISDNELQSLLIQWNYMYEDFKFDELRALQFLSETFDPILYMKLSRPYRKGFKDNRVNLAYLQSLEFEGLVKLRLNGIKSLFRHVRGEENIIQVMERIIELTEK